jgi:asparagine synthase (glutamine-hydrolysing)
MCGIFGAFNFSRAEVSRDVALAMSQSVKHRGPDADGLYSDERVLLGNRRLAILDLTSASNQPLLSEDGSIVLVQNGEIYNFIELRAEMAARGVRFVTNGDSEILLRAYQTWGPQFVTRLNGMFAIAVFDANEDVLYLYRDRLGVKPLYIAGSPDEGRIWFGSEIKAILANGRKYSPDAEALAQYFALNYIPQPRTAFSGISHLPPAHMARLSAAGISITRYWDLADVSPEPEMSSAEAQASLLTLLDDATRIRMRSDAPFGAFLSGGLDSSSVVAFMSMYRSAAVRTFSIGFDDARFDETPAARAASRRFGTMHTTKVMQPDVTGLWPRMIWHCDQPHGDVSFMPMLQVSELAARDVKMVLTGDGGDELFAGYEKYYDLLPGGRSDVTRQGWEASFVRNSGLLQNNQAFELLQGAVRDAFLDGNPYAPLEEAINSALLQDPINRVLHAETITLLPGNNLVKPDRMAMAESLEVRSPFLDYRMAEFAFRVPGSMKLRPEETKWMFKRAVEPLLGRDLTYRKKQMFTVPIGEWMRQALTTYCRELLLDGRLAGRGIVVTEAIEGMLAAHVKGTANHTRPLRALISLEIWFRMFVDEDGALLTQAVEPMENAA